MPAGVCPGEYPLPQKFRGAGQRPKAAHFRGTHDPHLWPGHAERAAAAGGGAGIGAAHPGTVLRPASLHTHRGPNTGHGRYLPRYHFGAEHEPLGAGGRGFRKDGGGRLRSLVCRPQRVTVRPHGPHRAAGRAALPYPDLHLGARGGEGGPAHRVGEGSGTEKAAGRAGAG